MTSRVAIVSVALTLVLGATTVFLWSKNNDLRDEIANLTAKVQILEQARNADRFAHDEMKTITKQAETTAKEKHDELDKIETDGSDLSESDFLQRLRGLLPKN